MQKQNSSKHNYSLEELLSQQIQHYQEMLKLEQSLQRYISDNDFSAVASNTTAKNLLMEKICAVDESISNRKQENKIGIEDTGEDKVKQKREKALHILAEIQQLEAENVRAVSKGKDKMIKQFQQVKQARRVAHGYRRSKTIFRTKLDTTT